MEAFHHVLQKVGQSPLHRVCYKSQFERGCLSPCLILQMQELTHISSPSDDDDEPVSTKGEFLFVFV
jgi:hypothetical protein